MKKATSLVCKLSVLAASLMALGAHAQSANKNSSVYGEVGLTQITYKEAGFSIKPRVLRGILGVDVHPNLAVEGMVGLGVAEDTIRVGTVDVTGDVDNTWGLYIKPKVSLAPNFDVFARFGYAKTQVSASLLGYSGSDTGGDFSYGVGASYKLTNQVSATVDYMSYYNKNGVKGTGLTLGLGFRF